MKHWFRRTLGFLVAVTLLLGGGFASRERIFLSAFAEENSPYEASEGADEASEVHIDAQNEEEHEEEHEEEYEEEYEEGHEEEHEEEREEEHEGEYEEEYEEEREEEYEDEHEEEYEEEHEEEHGEDGEEEEHLARYVEEDYDFEYGEDDLVVEFSLIYPKDNGTVPAYEPITIKWSNAPEVSSWRVEVFRDRVGYTLERVTGNTRLETIEARWVTPGTEFIVIIEPDLDGNTAVPRKFTFTVENDGGRAGDDESKPEGSRRREGTTGTAGRATVGIAPSWNTRNNLPGLWNMTQVRKEQDDVVRFTVNILSVGDDGAVDLSWGDGGRIRGVWDELRQALRVNGDEVYILHDGILGGASAAFSAVAIKADEEKPFFLGDVTGRWHMTEYRKDVNNDIIEFDVNIVSIDERGNAVVDWGDSGRIQGKWDALNSALTVHGEQVYIFQNDILAGGSGKYSGVAVRKAR